MKNKDYLLVKMVLKMAQDVLLIYMNVVENLDVLIIHVRIPLGVVLLSMAVAMRGKVVCVPLGQIAMIVVLVILIVKS